MQGITEDLKPGTNIFEELTSLIKKLSLTQSERLILGEKVFIRGGEKGIISLLYKEGYTAQEIQQITGLNINTIRSKK